MRWWSIRSRKSRGQSGCTSVRPAETTFPERSGA